MAFKKKERIAPRSERGSDGGAQNGVSPPRPSEPAANGAETKGDVITLETSPSTIGVASNGADNGDFHSPPGSAGSTASQVKPGTGAKERLGEQLIASHLITEAQLEQALAVQKESGGKIGQVLVGLGVLEEQTLAEALSMYFGLAVLNLRRDTIEATAVGLIPEEVAREHMAMPIRVDDAALFVAVAEPSDDLRSLLSKTSGHPVNLMIAPLSDIRWAIDSNYRAIGNRRRNSCRRSSRSRSRDDAPSDVSGPEIVADDAPVVQVVDRILTQAMRDRASDVHIEPSDDIVRVRFRIDGALKEILRLPAAIGPGLVSRIKIMANMNIVERRRPQDGQLTITIDGKEVDVRVATVATIMGESCVMRLLDKTRSVLRLNDLGMPADTHEAYSKIVRAPFGMVLCAGPTGSGKTTTLYATLSEVSNPTVNVMTIEDPVEYVFPDDQPDPDQRAGGAELRDRAEVHPPPGPRRHPRRRDPRRGDDQGRRAVGPHRSLRGLLDARHRLGLGPPPFPRHGHRVVPRGLVGARRRRSAPAAPDLPVLQDHLHANRRGKALLRGERRSSRKSSSNAARDATSAVIPVTRTESGSTSCS
jgi:hypothetical protein